MSDDYDCTVPDHFDRILWRGRYYGLPYPNHAKALEENDGLAKELGRLRTLLGKAREEIWRLSQGAKATQTLLAEIDEVLKK